jgi:RsiW-degrading membrane proteinase PrsW (M82 family)
VTYAQGRSAADRLLLGSPLRRPRVAALVIPALILAIVVSSLMIFVVVRSLEPGSAGVFAKGLALAAMASLVPIAVLWYLDRRERESRFLFVVAILWGALIATGLALPLNTAIVAAVGQWLSHNPALKEYLGPEAALLIGAPLAAPLVEELVKALGVLALFWLLRAEFDNMRDGLIYGALVGVGFNIVEAPLYVAQGFSEYGVAPWGAQFGARFALFGLGGHALFTGIFGAFLGLARQTARAWLRRLAPLVGLALAVLAHTLNNVLPLLVTVALRSAGEELPKPGPPTIGFVDAWLGTSAQNLMVFLPFVVLMLVLVWRSGVWERRVIREELAAEVGDTVTAAEYAQIERDGMFRTRRIERVDPRRSAALVNAQHELAFRKRRVRFDGADPDRDPLVAGWRQEIAELRAGRAGAPW